MDITELITADHDEAAQLFADLETLVLDDSQSSGAMLLAVRLAVAVKVHCHAEEKVVYAAMRTSGDELAALALEGPYEHQVLDLMLDKLVLHRPGPELRAILHVARFEFEHHARGDEEGLMLPALRRAFGTAERVQLGFDMMAEKRRMKAHIQRLVGPAPRNIGDMIRVHQHSRPRH